MKRLMDGVTYNTDTATLLAKSEYQGDWNNEECPVEAELFQTRGGAFFIVEEIDVSNTKPYADCEGYSSKTRFQKCSEDRAREWFKTGEVEPILNPFEDKDSNEETTGTVYTRVPIALKRRIEELAESAGLSANAWAIRCFEQCANATQRLARSE